MARFEDGELASLAEKVRRAAKFSPAERLDVPALLGKFECTANPEVRIIFRECSAAFMRGALARAEPKKRLVHYTDGLMGKLLNGDPVAAEVFLEEIAHVVLRHEANVLNHSIGIDFKSKSNFEIAAMELEAQKFVWYLQAPIYEVYQIQSAEDLVKSFGLTSESAALYFKHILETRKKFDRPRVVLQLVPAQSEISPALPAANNNSTDNSSHRTKERGKSQYSAFSHVPCKNCGMMTVIYESGCLHCKACGEEEGCG